MPVNIQSLTQDFSRIHQATLEIAKTHGVTPCTPSFQAETDLLTFIRTLVLSRPRLLWLGRHNDVIYADYDTDPQANICLYAHIN